jgi:hypothetical protein
MAVTVSIGVSSCSSDAGSAETTIRAAAGSTTAQPSTSAATPDSSELIEGTDGTDGTGDAPVGVAFAEAFDGDLSRWSIARWRQEGSGDPGYVGPAETVCGVADALPPFDVAVCDGHLEVSNASQNYGDLYLRAAQQFDVSGRTGTLTFDMTTVGTSLEGYPVLLFTDGPYSAPSYDADNASGPGPESGLLVQFDAQCVYDGQWVLAPQVRVWSNHVMTTVTTAGSECAPTSASPATLDHVEVRVSTTSIEISINGSLWFAADVGVPARSFVHLGVHNHATRKYNAHRAAWTTRFDNIVFDGPLLPVRVIEVADPLTSDGDGINVAYPLPTPELLLEIVPADAASAVLSLSMQANRGDDFATSTLNYRLNGGDWHSLGVQDADARPAGSSTYTWQIPVDVSELVAGANTLELDKTGFEGGWPAAVGNIDMTIM